MHKVVYLNEQKLNHISFETDIDTTDVWYLDDGESNNIRRSLELFLSLDETITGKVRR